MKTYFIRHSSRLAVDRKTIDSLWGEDRIAIHYPRDNIGDFEIEDSRSVDPSDYAGVAKHTLQRMLTLASEGGYVFATYGGFSGGKIGFVPPGSSIELFYGSWGGKNSSRKGRNATLKSLQLQEERNLSAEEAISLTAVQPRQGTLCRWKKVGQRVSAMVTGKPPSGVESLSPDQQEVMCMEYLRTPAAEKHGLPIIKSTLMPVGRTMKDIDILGVAENGKIVSAQVTFKGIASSGGKLKKLDSYGFNGNYTLFFCSCEKPSKERGHHVFPLSWVFEEFCVGSQEGRDWFRQAVGL